MSDPAAFPGAEASREMGDFKLPQPSPPVPKPRSPPLFQQQMWDLGEVEYSTPIYRENTLITTRQDTQKSLKSPVQRSDQGKRMGDS
jgi:hypothetical protein